MLRPAILDCDTGIDDALAIMLAVRSKELRLLGVTTTSGNVSLDLVCRNTAYVLELVGAGGRVPVIPGASKPLMRAAHHETHVHGDDGLGGAYDGDGSEAAGIDAGVARAADFIVEQVLAAPGEVTLIFTGPLTNLAHALMKCPDLPRHVRELVFMGGAVRTGGNVTPSAEYNMYADPEAAKLVFHSGMRMTMVGLDVTNPTLLTPEHIGRLRGNPAGEFVYRCTKAYLERAEELNSGYGDGFSMHDPLTVGIAIDRTLARTGSYYVDIETRSELNDGRTVCDFLGKWGKEPNMDVCLEVDSDRFLEHFVRTIGELSS